MTAVETFEERLRARGFIKEATPPADPHAAVLTLNRGDAGVDRYVAKALEAEVDRVAAATEGSRNDTLNRAAYSVGQLVAGGVLDAQIATDQLTAAARGVGLDDAEIRRTLTSAFTSSAESPRGVPELRRVAVPTLAPFEVNENGEMLVDPFRGLDVNALDGPLPGLDFLIDGRMTTGTLTLLGSKPGIGKSWLAQHMALAVAEGGCWLGHTARRGRVLYLDAENGDRLALRRLQQLGASSSAVADRLLYVTESMIFPGTRDTARLRVTLDQHRPDLVIIDTLASIAPTAEAGTEEASTFLAEVWHAVRDAGASMLLLCHLRKVMQGAGKDDPLSSFRGAGHLVGAAHRAWVLDPIGDERFVLRDVKTREFAAVPTVKLRIVDDGDGDALRTVLEVEGSLEEVEDGYDAFLQLALLAIDSSPIRQAATAHLLSLDPGVIKRTTERYLARATAAGILHRPRRGWWARVGDQMAVEDAS